MKDLDKLCTVAETLPKEQYLLLLPVFYLHLDLSTIPDANALEILMATATRLPCIDGALMSLNALAGLAVLGVIPIEALPDVWSRVSAWILFLHTYWDYLPGFHMVNACTKNPLIKIETSGLSTQTVSMRLPMHLDEPLSVIILLESLLNCSSPPQSKLSYTRDGFVNLVIDLIPESSQHVGRTFTINYSTVPQKMARKWQRD
ncbi:hypothetical protein B0H13DRAFT_1851507 [Mycena leptocephala]|nr:hypothetical protein B0H13DRAFT_1851507 [Mycena leptocephala]